MQTHEMPAHNSTDEKLICKFLRPTNPHIFFTLHLCAGVLSCFSRVCLFVTLWTGAHQVPLSMGFPRQESWSGWPFPSPGDRPNPGMEPASLALQADS